MVSFDNVASAGWFQVPPVGQFGLKFIPSAIAAMIILCIIEAVEAIGDLTSTACGGLDREPTEQEVSGGIVGNGICSVIGSIFGGSSVVVTTLAAILLNQILPPDNGEDDE